MSVPNSLINRFKDFKADIFINRMIRSAKLDASLYEEVKADKESLGQAMAVVVLGMHLI